MTSDDYAYVPGNLISLSGVLEKPESSTISSEQDPLQSHCSITTVYSLIYIRVKKQKSYNNLVTKQLFHKLSTIIITNHSSGVA